MTKLEPAEHLRRQAIVVNVIAKAPESTKRTLEAAFNGRSSPREAIKAMCLTCQGYDRAEIRNCTGYACALWMYRPFTEKEQGASEVA